MTNKLRMPCQDAVESVLDNCERYGNCMASIDPVTPHDVFRRYLFAYTTVNLSWQSSVKLYTELVALDWPARESEIRDVFIASRVGFHDTGPRYIADFAAKYFKGVNYLRFMHRPSQSWTELRRRLEKDILGLGLIKISFTMELCYPQDSEIVCLDRHMLNRIFHKDPAKACSTAQYEYYEQQWVRCCRHYGQAPAIVRLAYWDRMQGRRSPDYWAHVFKIKQQKEDVCIKTISSSI